MSPLIHFLIPFRSNVDYLRHTLVSIQRQTVDDWRATVFDDASEDEPVRDVVRNLSDERFSVHRHERCLGIGKNWDFALANSTGTYCTIVHADDMLLPTYAQTVTDLHKVFPSAFGVFTGARIIGPNGQYVLSIPDLAKKFFHPELRSRITVQGDKGLSSILRANFIFCPTLSFKRSMLSLPLFRARYRFALDLDMYGDALLSGKLLAGTLDPHYLYRRHAASTTAQLTSTRMRFNEEIDVYRQIADRASVMGWKQSARVARQYRIVKAHIIFRIVKSAITGQPRRSLDFAKLLRTR